MLYAAGISMMAFGILIRALLLTLCLAGPVAAQVSIPPGAQLDVPAGSTLDFSCSSLTMDGTLNLDGGLLTIDQGANFGNGSQVTGSGGTISVGGDFAAAAPLNLGTSSLTLRDGCNAGNSSQITGTIVVQNLTLSSTTGRTFILPAGANITVLGTLTLQGAPGQPLQLASAGGTAVINLGPAATVASNFATVPTSVQIGAATVALAPASIPTLQEWALLITSAMLGVLGALIIRQRKRQQLPR